MRKWLNPDILKAARRSAGLRVDDVERMSRELGDVFISTTDLARWEAGDISIDFPSLTHLKTLAKIYGCSVGLFYSEEVDPRCIKTGGEIVEIPPRDDLLQMAADLKGRLADIYNEIAELALVFICADDAGAMASQMVTSSQEIKTWADVYAAFGPGTIEPTDPISAAWWRAILKTDDPQHWLEEARRRELNAAQIRAEAGVKQDRRTSLLYNGGGTVKSADESEIAVYPDYGPAGIRPGQRVRLQIKKTQ